MKNTKTLTRNQSEEAHPRYVQKNQVFDDFKFLKTSKYELHLLKVCNNAFRFFERIFYKAAFVHFLSKLIVSTYWNSGPRDVQKLI